MSEFWGDLRASLRAWFAAPLLPLLTLALQVPAQLQTVSGNWMIAGAITGLFYIGYVGTERLWYFAVWNNKEFGVRDVWQTAWHFWPRFFVLGLLAGLALLLLLVPAFLLAWATDVDSPATRIALILPTFAFDIWLTFVTPALTFSTADVGKAISMGWAFLKQHWRHCVPYALAPPIASLILLQRAPEETIGVGARVALATTGILVYLALKGATAAYYLRHHGAEVDEEGALVSLNL